MSTFLPRLRALFGESYTDNDLTNFALSVVDKVIELGGIQHLDAAIVAVVEAGQDQASQYWAMSPEDQRTYQMQILLDLKAQVGEPKHKAVQGAGLKRILDHYNGGRS
jgi:hypothetical protein